MDDFDHKEEILTKFSQRKLYRMSKRKRIGEHINVFFSMKKKLSSV